MLEFTYTKANGDQSQRKLVPLGRPSVSYFGLDVTEIEENTITQLQGILARQKEELDEFLAEKELTRNYRTFLADGVDFGSIA